MKLFKKSFFSILAILLFNFNIVAQNISGVVVREDNGKAIPFVSIAIEGTTLGTVSDFEGAFDLEVLSEFENGQLIVSCVGFKDKKVGIKNIFEKTNVKIKLASSSVDIDEVVVEQKSLYPYTILKNAISAISANYINMPYNYEFYYSNKDKKARTELKREAIVLLYDKDGYARESVYKTFKSINYMFLHSKRNFEVKYLNDGNTNIDDLLEFDIVRHRGNILDGNRIYDYDVVIKDNIEYRGDSVWVLSYSMKRPDFVKTGDFLANFYSGEIFIKKDDYAIVYNKSTVKSSNYSRISRNIYGGNKEKKNAVYTFEVRYKQQKEYYCLENIDYKNNFGNLERESKIDVLKNYTEKPHIVSSRDYYENLDFDKDFWLDFKL